MAAWLLALALIAAAPVSAQDDEAPAIDPEVAALLADYERLTPEQFEQLGNDRRAKMTRYPMGKRISRYLTAAQEEFEADRPAEAEALLLKLDPKRLNPLERASVYRFLAYVAYASGDPIKARDYFQKVLDQEILQVRDETKIRLNAAQLSAQAEDWQGVVDWVNEYVKYSAMPDPLAFYLKSLAYYQLDQVDDAIKSIQTALELAPEPREAWLRLLATMYTQKEDFRSAAPVFEELLIRFPKKAYWVQLSLIYGALEDYPRSLSVQQIAYAQGFLTEDKELRRLARSYLFRDLPYPAAKVLEKGLEDGQVEPDSEIFELLANSWISAREYDKSLPPLRKAAELSEDGKLYVRLGQVMMQGERWDDAHTMLEKALEKGGLDEPGDVVLLLGVASYNGAQYDRARRYFQRASKYESSKGEAQNWITHMEREAASAQG